MNHRQKKKYKKNHGHNTPIEAELGMEILKKLLDKYKMYKEQVNETM